MTKGIKILSDGKGTPVIFNPGATCRALSLKFLALVLSLLSWHTMVGVKINSKVVCLFSHSVQVI